MGPGRQAACSRWCDARQNKRCHTTYTEKSMRRSMHADIATRVAPKGSARLARCQKVPRSVEQVPAALEK
jgi:hypothetical protein